MFKHLRSCYISGGTRKIQSQSDPNEKLFYIGIQDRYLPEYWLYLEVPGSYHLTHLDQFLRDTWLECCGHLSEFEIENVKYELPMLDDNDDEVGDFMGFMFGMLSKKKYIRKKMDIKLDDVLKEKMKFSYIYDFGSSTTLECKVLQIESGMPNRRSIKLLARNILEEFKCMQCKGEATSICAYCYYDHFCYFCDRCGESHLHEDDEEDSGESFMVTLSANSPRTAICGYPPKEFNS